LYVLLGSHLKVHTAIEPGLAGEQSVFAVFLFLLLVASILLLAMFCCIFSSCIGLSDEHSMSCKAVAPRGRNLAAKHKKCRQYFEGPGKSEVEYLTDL
jgi:hypothetical protein